MSDPLIYLDHNATTPLAPEAWEAMNRAATGGLANPASGHAAGRRARRLVEDARERIGEILGLDTSRGEGDRLIFTSGGTEANNWALSAMASGDWGTGDTSGSDLPPSSGSVPHALVSAIEHPSVLGPAARLAEQGLFGGRRWDVERIAVDREGRVVVADFLEKLRPSTRLVSVMLGNNETGVVQPVAEIASECRRRGIFVHTDAVQAVGKIGVDFRSLAVDAMTVAAHKFHGPLGIGGLALRHGVEPRPLLVGGFQQSGLRPGTESPLLVAGMLAALEAWYREASARTHHLAMLRDDLQRRLVAACGPTVVLGAAVERLPQTLNIAFVGLDRQALFVALDAAGVACSTGSACASGSSEPSPTLLAMGRSEAEISGALRFSVGASTTAAEVIEGATRISRVVNELRDRFQARKIAAPGRF
jgi:cysteine desulfurase